MQPFLLIFIVLTISGAWAGWRRSPLYSRSTTFKLIGAFLLIVASIGGITAAIMSGPVHFSPTAQAVLAGLTVIVVGVGATALIIRISDSHVAQLPAAARIVNTERHKVQRWIWRVLAYLLISAAAALVLPSSWAWAPLALGSLVLLGSGPSLMALYMRARRLDLGMSSVLAAPWAHWQYSPAEWQAWTTNQLAWERAKLAAAPHEGRKLLKAVALMVAIFLAGSWLTVSGSAGDKLTAAGLAIAVLALFIGCLYLVGHGAPQRLYRRLLKAPPEVLFGDEGVYCDGRFSLWILSGSYLVEAAIHRDAPPRLVLAFQNFNGSSSVRVEKRIPIPQGRESDVMAIGQKLRARCPKAAIRLA